MAYENQETAPTAIQVLDFLAKAQRLGMDPWVQLAPEGYYIRLVVSLEDGSTEKESVFFYNDGVSKEVNGSYPFDLMVSNVEEDWAEYEAKQAREKRKREILAAMSEEDRKLFT